MIFNPMIPLIVFIPIMIIIIIIIYRSNKKIEIEEIVIILLLILINIRPMIVNDEDKVLKNNLDILFVIDNSISMIANDYKDNETRLDGVKKVSAEIIKEFNGARFSLMTFSNVNRIVLPYLSDANTAIEAIQDISVQDELYARGTSLNTPLNDIIKSLESAKKKEDRRRIIFFFSDGEITNDDKLQSFAKIKDYITDGAILGFGTTQGANMLITDKFTNKIDYLYDYSEGYKKAVSKIDENNLKQIASDIDINYIHVTKENDCNKKINDIKNILKNQITDENKMNYTDIYYLFTIPLFLVILYRFYRLRRKLI